jgi:hypothetical protein
MGKPMMIQDDDDQKIESLKKRLGAKTKIEVLRIALQLLETDLARSERVKRWQKAVKVVGTSGLDILREFQTSKRFAKLP